MRTWVAGLVFLTLLAGCFGKGSTPTTTAPAAQAPTTGSGLQGLQANDTVNGLPAAFGGGFRVVSAATGFHGGEPNIGVTSKGHVYTTAVVPDAIAKATALVGYGAVIKSTDGGKKWTEATDPTHDPQTLDPMLWVDRQTDRVFSNQLNVACSWMSFTDDDGATWTPSPAACGLPAADHQKLASGPYSAASPYALAAGSPLYPNVVTFCYNKIGGTFCAVSFDGGLHFVLDNLVDLAPTNGAIATDRSCGGINGHQKFGPDGTIYVPYGLNCGQAFVATSTDSGATWVPHRLGAPQFEIDPAVTVTPDGMAYYMGRGDDQGFYLFRSKDHFATHEGPFRITPPNVNGTVFAGLTSGSDGRIAFAYLGHKGDLARPGPVHTTDQGGNHTRWYLYVGMSLNAEDPDPYFLINQATPDSDPVQVGCVQITREQGPDGNQLCNQRNMLDFIDMQTDNDGRFWIAYTDGCTSPSCASPDALPVDSRDNMVTVARLEEGPSLYADKGRLSPT
ncbi:MAG TPA: sialidase family protein [Candidatus Thermoplasmatota archaeon]|nr:sialidase family protein [Candidatus Thermoplasmatota archaeon]